MTIQPTLPSSLKRRIIEKIQLNKLTIIVGPTGCGKSSIVPQLLLDSIGSPILCTQPRRLAVVAVATYVAKQRGEARLGKEVGYHVGQDKMANHETGLLFATAGILLEELKGQGLHALTKYKVVIIDECHERSCESELVLTIIKQFMIANPRSNLKLVLMSATFNHNLYTSFFNGVPGCEYVDTITLQTAESIDAFYSKVQTHYLEDISRMLASSVAEHTADYMTYCNAMKCDPMGELDGSGGGKALSHQLLLCIMSLVNHLHCDESPDSIFLVFAPTYRHLEQIYSLLGVFQHFDLGVLHSTIDIEDCLKSMQGAAGSSRWNGGRPERRKILLASAIADSSITIPNVTCVIDTCRSLEVKWNSEKSKYNVANVWSSRAICDQRRGRTGRTCSGRVFRLVHQGFYNNSMEEWEQPKIGLASCRDEVLSLLSSKNKVMSDPQALLEKCIDPPSTANVTKAIEYIIDIGAARQVFIARKRKVILTELGRLISSLPFTVEEAGVAVHGAKHGLLHEAVALSAIKSTRPHPIVNAFGDDESNRFNLSRYFPQVDVKDPMSVAIANLAAYIFWYVNWNTIRRHEMKDHFKKCTGEGSGISSHFFGEDSSTQNREVGCNVGTWSPAMDQAHSDWCRGHFINPSSVKSISQHVALTMNTFYRSEFEPEWLKCQQLEPMWNRDQIIQMQKNDVFSSLYGPAKGRELSSNSLVRLQKQALSRHQVKATEYACIHYLNGHCRFGDSCKNVHSLSAPRPLCQFHLRGGCTNSECLYVHQEPADIGDEKFMVPPIYGTFLGGAGAWYHQNSSSMFLFGKCGLRQSLEAMGSPPKLALDRGSTIGFARFHTYKNSLQLHTQITKCAWNFPCVDGSASDEENESLLQGFFMSAAAYFQPKLQTMSRLEVGLTLQQNEFSKWNVMHVAQNAGFCLEWYDVFDCSMFPNYEPRDSNNELMEIQDARFYVFRMKKNVLHNPPPRMMELREEAQFGIELEMSSTGYWTLENIALEISSCGTYLENIGSYKEGKITSNNWKLVTDGSLHCNISQPDCHRFELVSPILLSEKGLSSVANILEELSDNINLTVNKSMGFHVHVDVSKYSIPDRIKICQQFMKYENAIDSMMPHSRRTGSKESDHYFKSNIKTAKESLGKSEEGVMNALESCKGIEELANIVNADGRRFYKLNLQNLVNRRQPTIEFRQHSSTSNYEKVDAWVRFCLRFCENSVSLESPAFFSNGSQNSSIDEQFDDLFKNVIRDSVLYSYYRKRRHLLSVDDQGDACCHGCLLGRECSK